MERESMFGCGIGITKAAHGAAPRGWVVPDCHASVSGLHSESALGDEESIDKKRPKISKTATIAPASITRLPPSAKCKCN
jgi:hypothetical protein